MQQTNAKQLKKTNKKNRKMSLRTNVNYFAAHNKGKEALSEVQFSRVLLKTGAFSAYHLQ